MTPAIQLLIHNATPYTLHEYQHDAAHESYGLEAAEKLNQSPQRVFKTLVLANEKSELFVVVLPVCNQVSLKKVANIFKSKKMNMADPKKVTRTTGYIMGGVSPLGQKNMLKTVIDNSAQLHASIFISAGKRGVELELTAQDVAQHTKAIFADIIA